MTMKSNDWDPRAEHVLNDPLHSYDLMRERCPVAYSTPLQWSLFRYKDILEVLQNHQQFSSAVSTHISVPNSMDPPTHTVYRNIIEPYFSSEALTKFEPKCWQLAQNLVKQIPVNEPFDAISQLARRFALEAQCDFIGWPRYKQIELWHWMEQNHAASLSGDSIKLEEVASSFSTMVTEILAQKRTENSLDVIGSLTRANVQGRPLKDEEIVSILRNWTGGEVGTISAAVGIIIYFLAAHYEIQQELRQSPDKIPEAIEEILRIHGPLITNRRVATCPFSLNGQIIEAGERVTLFWVSANRDESIFEQPYEFKWGRNQEKNLMYGAGIHVCPGAPLARLELRIFIEVLLAQTHRLSLAQPELPSHAVYPAGGYTKIMIVNSTDA